MPSSWRRRSVLVGYGVAGIAVAASAVSLVLGVAANTVPIAKTDKNAIGDPSEHKFDPARVVGAKACIRCHRAEYVDWMKTVHFRSDRQLIAHANTVKYAEALKIPKGDILKNSLCATCHATLQKSESGAVAAHGGVSCESCHGPSGGDPGWLNRHAVYGLEGTRREHETAAHRAARMAFCRKHGKIGPEDLYATARRCLQCHLIGNEELVKAGHPVMKSPYEFASWSSGEVRHNYHMDQSKNAGASSLWMNPVGKPRRSAQARLRQMYVIGILADVEMTLQYRSKTKDAALAGTLGGRIGTAQGKLATLGDVPQLKPVTDSLPVVLTRVFAVQKDDAEFYAEHAGKVAKAAREFLAKGDLSKLNAAALKALDDSIPKSYTPAAPTKKP